MSLDLLIVNTFLSYRRKMSINPFGAKLTLEGPIKPLKEGGSSTISYKKQNKNNY